MGAVSLGYLRNELSRAGYVFDLCNLY